MFWYFTCSEEHANLFKNKAFSMNGFIEAYSSESLAKFHRAPIDTQMVTLLIQRDETRAKQMSQDVIFIDGEDFPYDCIQAYNRIR